MENGGNLNLLDNLKKRQSELEWVNHPMIGCDDSFRYLYAFGLGVMALGNMKAMMELQDYFDTVLDRLCISRKNREQIITDINNYFDFRITECTEKLKEKEVQYCFTFDLYKIYQLSLWSQDYCEKILDYYQQIFRFSDIEREFFEGFSECASRKDTKKAIEIYNIFRKKGYDIRYSILTYFFPDFILEEEYGDIVVKAGKTFVIDKPTTVNGDIKVERGGSLLMNGGILKIHGGIISDGGRIRLYSTRIRVIENNYEYFMHIDNAAIVQISDSFIDCGKFTGFMKQTSGRLIITDTIINNVAKNRALSFYGRSAVISRSRFVNCKNGALALYKRSRVEIKNCEFTNCEAEYGAALYSESIGNVKCENCVFDECKARYLGAAVYFKYQKFGQFMKNCSCKQCIPEESQIFNVYDDDFEIQRIEKRGSV